MYKFFLLKQGSVLAVLCVCGIVFAQDITEVSLNSIQDTVPHCGTVGSLGPLCSTSQSKKQRHAAMEKAVQKAIKLLSQRASENKVIKSKGGDASTNERDGDTEE